MSAANDDQGRTGISRRRFVANATQAARVVGIAGPTMMDVLLPNTDLSRQGDQP